MSLSRKEIVSIAIVEASRILAKNKVSCMDPVDIFGIIEKSGIILNFQRLDNLAGAYLPETEKSPPGILINENLPLTRQRYTAAHELCHFIRSDSTSFDTSSELFYDSYKRDDKEKIAEEFASCILMPRKLLKNILLKIGLMDKSSFTPKTVYELALRLGTSYEATVNRLATLNMITKSKYNNLKIPPIKIKKSYGTDNLKTNWNDIWILKKEDNNSTIYPIIGDEVRVILEENPTTGYKWISCPNTEEIISSWKPIYADNNILGGKGVRTFNLKIEEVQEIILKLYHNRPWLPLSRSIDNFSVNIFVQNKRHGIRLEQLIA